MVRVASGCRVDESDYAQIDLNSARGVENNCAVAESGYAHSDQNSKVANSCAVAESEYVHSDLNFYSSYEVTAGDTSMLQFVADAVDQGNSFEQKQCLPACIQAAIAWSCGKSSREIMGAREAKLTELEARAHQCWSSGLCEHWFKDADPVVRAVSCGVTYLIYHPERATSCSIKWGWLR